jgi:glycosyltransferase involved in cell wall biosynthesis
MRVSLINLNLVAHDAIGRTMLDQIRFFRRRGDQVQAYLMYPPQKVGEDVEALTHAVQLSDLITRQDEHFIQSDLFVYHYPGRYALLESIKEIERGAVIFYHHNVTPPELWTDTQERENLRRSLESVGLYTHYADLVVTDSLFNADQLVQQHSCDRDRIRVLPQAVALDKFTPGPRNPALLKQNRLEGRRVILFVGRMAGNKRIDVLVEALPFVQQKVPEAVLMLVGDDRGNPDFQEIVAHARTLAVKRGVSEDVIFTGVVNDLPSYYRLADVYATASLHEGFGVPLIEAMASGVPVVASRTAAHPWVIGEAGLLVEPGDAADLADKIVRLLTDDGLHGRLTQLGLERAREFSLERYEDEWAKIVAEATAWLPDKPYARLYSLTGQTSDQGFKFKHQIATAEMRDSLLRDELQQLQESADVMMRDYVVHSKLPVVGSLVTSIRRNLTSHLREPYVDPTFERQVSFNWQVIGWFKRALVYWMTELARERERLDTRVAQLEAEIAQLRAQVDRLTENEKDRQKL